MNSNESLEEVLANVRKSLGNIDLLDSQVLLRNGVTRYTAKGSNFNLCSYWDSWLSGTGEFRENVLLVGNMSFDDAAVASIGESWSCISGSEPATMHKATWCCMRREGVVMSHAWLRASSGYRFSLGPGSQTCAEIVFTVDGFPVQVFVSRENWLPQKICMTLEAAPRTGLQQARNSYTIRVLTGIDRKVPDSRLLTILLRNWQDFEGTRFPKASVRLYSAGAHAGSSRTSRVWERSVHWTETLRLMPEENSTFKPPLEVLPPNVMFPFGQSRVDVPFELFNNLVCVSVMLNQEKLRFAVDSGTSSTIIDSDTAERLKLKLFCDFSNVVGGGERKTRIDLASGVELKIGDLEYSNHNVMVTNIRPLMDCVGVALDGILGNTFLARVITAIDFRTKTIGFVKPGSFTPHPQDMKIEFEMIEGVPVIEGAIEQDDRVYNAKLMVDTGFGGYQALLNTPFVKNHGLLNTVTKVVAARSYGLSGTVDLSVGRLQALTIGDRSIGGVLCGMCESASGSTSATEYDGFIGNTVLGGERLTFDFTSSCLYVCLENEICQYNMSGLSVICGDNFHQYVVSYIAESTPAAAVDIKINDVISDVDGARPADLAALQQRFQVAGDLRLGIRRGESSHSVNLVLKPLV